MDIFHTQESKNCLLIIDDDAINREVLKNIFADLFVFEEAENGQEGLEKIYAHKNRLCAIVTDVNMPVMDGIDVLRTLYPTGLLSEIPVFMITANDELDVSREAYQMGVMGVINKPVVPFVVRRRVELVVELFRARESLSAQVQDREEQLEHSFETIDELHRSTIQALASAIEFRDVESGEHTNRIYDICKCLLAETAMGEGFTGEEIENMATGAIMHDVGKIAISDVILNKPGKLTHAEYETMKLHTVKGGELMAQLLQTQSHASYLYAADIARHHHERWDGGGYPDGLKGEEITVWSQVASIADVYDALVSPRVYKKAYTADQAVEMIRNGECGVFNPKLLDCFLQVEPKLRAMYADVAAGEAVAVPAVSAAQAEEENENARALTDVLLLSAAVNSAYDMIICANLTRNSFYMMDYDRFLTHCVGYDGVFDELIAAGSTSIPESHRQRFIDTFCRENLLKAFAEGRTAVELNHPQYTDDGRLMDVTTNVLLVEDPRNGDIMNITLSRYNGEIRESEE